LDKILDEAENSKKEVLELCSRLVQFDTAHPESRTDECVAFIQDYFGRNGIATEVHSINRTKPNIVAKIPGLGKSKILWIGYLDVVPVHSAGSWTYPPFSGRITGEGHIHGRGASDMKGACAAAMVAARILSESDETPPNSVEFWFTADEEIGGGDGTRWLAKDGRLKGDVCIIGDGEGGGLMNPCIDLGCKGALPTRLTARGKAAHGSAPFLGDNAISKLMDVIPWVERIREYRLDLPEEVEDLVEGTLEFMMKDRLMTGEQKSMAEYSLYHPTVSVNNIKGGVKINVVPDYAEAEFDIRITPGADPLKVKERIEELVSEAGVPGVEVDVPSRKVSGYFESTLSLCARQFAETVRRVTGKTPIFKFLLGGTDAISIKRYENLACIGYGTAMNGQAHQVNEYNSIENLVTGLKVYAGFPFIYSR
jgi:succinyl-diaminopimelate desuccinylase